MEEMCHLALENLPPPNNLRAFQKGVEKEPRTSKVCSGWKLHPGAERIPQAGHSHGNQSDPRAGLLSLGADHRPRDLQPPRWELGHLSPCQQTRPGLDRGFFLPTPSSFQGAQTYLGELRGPGEVRGASGSPEGPWQG